MYLMWDAKVLPKGNYKHRNGLSSFDDRVLTRFEVILGTKPTSMEMIEKRPRRYIGKSVEGTCVVHVKDPAGSVAHTGVGLP